MSACLRGGESARLTIMLCADWVRNFADSPYAAIEVERVWSSPIRPASCSRLASNAVIFAADCIWIWQYALICKIIPLRTGQLESCRIEKEICRDRSGNGVFLGWHFKAR